MPKNSKWKPITTKQAPQAIGTYSQAVQFEKLIFLSGQIPLDPKTQELISQNFLEQTKQVFINLKALARACGGDLNDIIKLTVYLTDMKKFSDVNVIMAEFFDEPYPARAAVGVAELPKQVQIEIEGIMCITSEEK